MGVRRFPPCGSVCLWDWESVDPDFSLAGDGDSPHVHRRSDGWYWEDEVGWLHGPCPSEDDAWCELEGYAHCCLRDQSGRAEGAIAVWRTELAKEPG